MSIFSFSSVQHFAASAISDLHKVLKFIEKEAPVVVGTEPLVEGVTAIALGAASPVVTIERAAFAALGHIVVAVQAADDAAAVHGVSLTLDSEAVVAFKELIAEFKGDLAKIGYKL